MTITKGSVVRAKAGRDKDKFFVVLRIENGFAFIADGRRRKCEAPKRKNLIHLERTNTVLSETMDTNRKLRNALKSFSEGTL